MLRNTGATLLAYRLLRGRVMTQTSTRLLAIACLAASIASAPACDGSGGGGPGSGNPIHFDSPAVGQQSRYAVLLGEKYGDPADSPFRYVDGVLLAEIVGHDDTGFRVRESFEVPLDVSQDARLEALEPDAVYEYRLRMEGDALTVVYSDANRRSRLFRSWADHALPLADVASPATTIFGWRPALPYCECYEQAYVANGEIHDATYDRLNVVVDNEAMQTDGPGATKIYSAHDGLVRSIHYSWWTRRGEGFDLIAGD